MQQSQQVLEWQAEGELRTLRGVLQMLLEDRLGPLSEALRKRIDMVDDVERLYGAVRRVYKMQSPDALWC